LVRPRREQGREKEEGEGSDKGRKG